jgi:hypothetical protein
LGFEIEKIEKMKKMKNSAKMIDSPCSILIEKCQMGTMKTMKTSPLKISTSQGIISAQIQKMGITEATRHKNL